MRSVYICLDKGSLVKDFVETIKNLDGKFELRSGFAVLDAQSMLGIFCLDLSKPILLMIENDSADNMRLLARFILNGELKATFEHLEGNKHEETSV
jgi:hypothetical protein